MASLYCMCMVNLEWGWWEQCSIINFIGISFLIFECTTGKTFFQWARTQEFHFCNSGEPQEHTPEELKKFWSQQQVPGRLLESFKLAWRWLWIENFNFTIASSKLGLEWAYQPYFMSSTVYHNHENAFKMLLMPTHLRVPRADQQTKNSTLHSSVRIYLTTCP